MSFNTQSIFFSCWYSILVWTYFYTFGIPATWQEALYASFFVGVLGGLIILVFLLTLIIFGLPIPDAFKLKKK